MGITAEQAYGAAKNYTDKTVESAVASVYKPAGSKTVAELTSSLLVAENLGKVYNMSDSGTTTADFVEGAGKEIHAGDNVDIVDVGTGESHSYKFDLLSGADLSEYIKKSQTAGLVKNDGTIDQTPYVSDVSGKTNLTVVAPVEASTTASQPYAQGDYFVLNGKFYEATAAIAQDGTIVVSGAGQNATERTLAYVLENGGGHDSTKADKVAPATNGNFAGLDSNGNLTDSGHKHSDYLTSHQDISGKADKVTSATNGNFAGLDANGNLTDSGHKHSDYLTQHQDITGKADKAIPVSTGNLAALDSSGNLTDSGVNIYVDPVTGGYVIAEDLELTNGGAIRAESEITAGGDIQSRYGDVKDGEGNVLSKIVWSGTSSEWTNLPAATKRAYAGKAVLLTDDAGVYTGMPQPYTFTLTGTGSTVTATFSHASIKADMRVIEAVLGNPSAVLSDITVTPANGSLTVSAVVNGTTTVELFMQECKTAIALT